MLASAGALVLAGALVGIEELYALAVAVAILLGVAAAWVNGRSWELSTLRNLHPQRVAAGDTARVELLVRNPLRHRSPVIAVRDPFDGGRRAANFLVAPLDPGQADRAAYRLPTAQRGVFALGPLELSLSDPFGLVARTRTGAAASTLTVHPRVDRVHPPRVIAGSDRQSDAGAAVVGIPGGEFFALRDYRTGDDLRRVHWAATARVGELMIRQEETANRGRVTVAVDLRADAWRSAALEIALSGAASVAEAAARAGTEVRLVHTGGTDTGFAGPSRRGRILDELAVAAPHRDRADSLALELRRLGVGRESGTTVAFTSDLVTDAELGGLARTIGRSGPLVIVVVERDPHGGPGSVAGPRSSGGATVVRVGATMPFAVAWDRAMGAGRSPAWSDD
jgi:uncharacterized protein (DUF58 family)